MTTFQTLVDHHLVRHYVRETDIMGSALCGMPPKGTKLDDPMGDMRADAPYVDECDSCRLIYIEEMAKRAVAEMYRIGPTAVSAEASVRALSVAAGKISDSELLKRVADGTDSQKWEVVSYKDRIQARRADHTHRRPPPDPLTSSWEDLLEEDA